MKEMSDKTMRTIIENCTLVDGINDNPIENAWVLLENKLISSIGIHDQQKPPKADLRIDARGGTLLPGLFNLHVHIQRRHLSKKGAKGTFREGAPYIENSIDTKRMLWAFKNAWKEIQTGVTTIRDCSSKNRINIDLRNSIKEGIIKGPDVIACGFGIAATGGHETHKYQGAVEVDGPDEIRKAVRNEIKAGADFIKFMGSGGIGGMPENEDPNWVEMGIDELQAGITEAHNRGKKTTVHAMGEQAIMNALIAGIDCIEHGVMLSDRALDIMCENGINYVPTVSGITAVYKREAESGKKEVAELINERVVKPLNNSIQKAYKSGITIGCGTDTLGDVVEELKIFEACGMSKIDCIRTATLNAAKICGLEDIVGTVEVGKRADLLIVEKSPFEDLENLRSVFLIFKEGIIVDYNWLINQG